MAAEAELAKERLTNQGNLDRDTLIHKHNLEVQALRESLRQTEERLGQTKREAEEEKRHLVAEQEEIKSKVHLGLPGHIPVCCVGFDACRYDLPLPHVPGPCQLAEVEAGAMAARRRLEDMVEEARGNLETLEADHREVMVEKGLLIGANKSLNERVEGLLSLLEERQAHSEAQMAALKADHQAALENRQNEHNRRITDMTRQVKELEEDMQTKQRLQVCPHAPWHGCLGDVPVSCAHNVLSPSDVAGHGFKAQCSGKRDPAALQAGQAGRGCQFEVQDRGGAQLCPSPGRGTGSSSHAAGGSANLGHGPHGAAAGATYVCRRPKHHQRPPHSLPGSEEGPGKCREVQPHKG